MGVHPRPAAAAAPVRTGRAGRTLLGYLLVPRPKDLVKAVVAPLAFGVGVVAAPGAARTGVGLALVVWLALELLVYQARYQWNDVRGFAADQAHPDAASRGRLPGPASRARSHVAASLGVLFLRLLLTAGLAVAVPRLAVPLIVMTVGVFGAAAVYERLRTAATGATSQVPVPLRPALLGLWVVVGAGYAVRGTVGLGLAVDLQERPGTAAVAVVAMWASGVLFVTCRWALEALCLAEVDGQRPAEVDGQCPAEVDGRRILWQVRPEQAREHTLGLVRWLPARLPDDDGTPRSWRALRGRTPLGAPWNLALVAAAGSAALLGRLLLGQGGAGAAALTLLLGALAGLAVAVLPAARPAAVLVLGLALAGVQAVLGVDRPLAAVVPWLVVLLLHACSTGQCADDVGRPLRRLQPPPSR